MKVQRYYPSRASDQIQWLRNFAAKLPGQAAVLNLSATQVTPCVTGCNFLVYELGDWLTSVRNFSLVATSACDLLANGTGATPVVLPTFTAPALPAGVAPVAPGVLTGVFALVQIIKNSPGYTPTIGLDLGIEGTQPVQPDLTTIQPDISVQLLNADQVLANWGWGGNSAYLDMIELQVDRNDGKGYVLLAYDTTPGYTDTAPFPAVPTKWKYKAIYRLNDQRVGLWSKEVSITVGG